MSIRTAIEHIKELQSVSGSTAKLDILRKYSDDKDFKKLLYYALNPMLTYKVSEKTLRTKTALPDIAFPDLTIYDVCDTLNAKSALTNDDIGVLAQFLVLQREDEMEFYIQLLSKTLRLGVTSTTINKIFPGLIPSWEVQQAYRIDDHPVKPGKKFWLTQKLNGVRATYYRGKIYARSGVPYEGLAHIIRVLNDLVERIEVELVFDGELTLFDKGDLSDNEAFRTSTGIINSDATDKTMIGYTIFDVLTADEFDAGGGTVKYSERRENLDLISSWLRNDYPDAHVSVLPELYHGKDASVIDGFLDQMVREDKEGLMLNYDVPYKRKRHGGILKIKRFYTMDLRIIGAEEGTGRLAGTLGALVLDYKGNEVRVGTGFSDDQREKMWNDRDKIIGMLCEVKYKEISSDKKTGAESLQFPVFVSMRSDKGEVSYW